MIRLAVPLLVLIAQPALCQPDDDLVDMFRKQVAPCWKPPAEAQAASPEKRKVIFEIILAMDGGIAQPPQFSANPKVPAADPLMRSEVEAARRAIWACAPYKLPPNRYEQWRDIVMTFDASPTK